MGTLRDKKLRTWRNFKEFFQVRRKTELQLVKDLSAKAVGLRVRGDGVAACRELHHRLIVGGFVVDSLRLAACGSDHLLGQITFAVIIVTDGMHHSLCRDQLALYGDIALGGADDSAFLVLIIYNE